MMISNSNIYKEIDLGVVIKSDEGEVKWNIPGIGKRKCIKHSDRQWCLSFFSSSVSKGFWEAGQKF